jgi:hypothetical protein
VLEPTPIGAGVATAEQLLDGVPVDGHDPAVRGEMAARLHEFIVLAAPTTADSFATSDLMTPTSRTVLWGDPHDVRFDFEATSAGAEWIDRIAAGAQGVLRAAVMPDVIAHFDWRVENLAFRGSGVVGVFDWDSVGRAPEAVAVGQSSAQFSTDWTIGHSTLPSVEEMSAFVADYEAERGSRFTNDERSVVEAANLMVLAYCSRCEHSDRVLQPHPAPATGGWASLLERRSTTVLAS